MPDKYVTEKAMISGRENVCQEWDCVRGIGANLMQVYIAYTAPFGNYGRLMDAKDAVQHKHQTSDTT